MAAAMAAAGLSPAIRTDEDWGATVVTGLQPEPDAPRLGSDPGLGRPGGRARVVKRRSTGPFGIMVFVLVF